ncbi:MAG: SagB/ThcOx family dehydrogenase [Thermodesulfobacteriota bacterium]
MSHEYHQATAYARQAMGGHCLDWAQRPHPFKRYRVYAPRPLAPPRRPRAAFFDVACAWPPPAPEPADGAPALDAAGLAGMLETAAGLTAMTPGDPDGGGLRAWASAGALYPCELYLTAAGVAGLADGLYHFAPELPGLTPLWPGATAAAAARPLGRDPAGLTLCVSGYYWRSLWKYRSRAYRYCLLDAGHLAANLELACAAAGLTPRPAMDFADRALNVFLGLASDDEAALYALQAGPAPSAPSPASPGLPPLDREARPLSARMGRDQGLLAAHAAGELEDPAGPRAWPRVQVGAAPLTLPAPAPGGPDLAETIRRRRSRRNFVPAGLDAAAVARLLAAALPAEGPALATVLLGPGGELPAGAHLYLPAERALAPLGGSDRRAAAAAACLGQMWAGQAALVLLLWHDLAALAQRGGARTYRHALLHAGRVGQRLYLAATALGLGCCGVGAFYDRELALAAGLPPGGDPLYLLACGPVKGGPR